MLEGIPSIGTHHHALEEDQMIVPQAQEAQQQNRSSNLYRFGEKCSLQGLIYCGFVYLALQGLTVRYMLSLTV
jgi:hypothetical protein